MIPQFKYDTYADVRRNVTTLVAGGLVFLAVLAIVFLSDEHRSRVQAAIPGLEKLYTLVVLPLAWIVAFILVDLLRAPDQYDRFVIRWRPTFDLDVIITRLYLPLAEHVDRRFLRVAADNRRDFMNVLFYHFVRDPDPVIRKGLVVRFYERVSWYWFWQVMELLLLCFAGGIVLYRVLNAELTPADKDRIFLAICMVGVLIVVNRLFVRSTRARVRMATLEEIDDIVNEHRPALQDQVQRLAKNYQIPNTL